MSLLSQPVPVRVVQPGVLTKLDSLVLWSSRRHYVVDSEGLTKEQIFETVNFLRQLLLNWSCLFPSATEFGTVTSMS